MKNDVGFLSEWSTPKFWLQTLLQKSYNAYDTLSNPNNLHYMQTQYSHFNSGKVQATAVFFIDISKERVVLVTLESYNFKW